MKWDDYILIGGPVVLVIMAIIIGVAQMLNDR